MEDDGWDLSAVVRSCRSSSAAGPSSMRDPFSSFPPPLLKPDEEPQPPEGGKGGAFPLHFPDLFENRGGGLQELLKPFFQKVQQQVHVAAPASPSSTTLTAGAFAAGPRHQLPRPLMVTRQGQRPLSQAPRSKRRKNQQKKVVCHVPADGLSSDMWAWRKYGQKPIKGSPYPRGYYRCSSSKGCLARKQVERCRSDPAMFIITYTGEHNHPMPTHRNSLAGSTRSKFPAASSSGPAEGDSGAPDHQVPLGNPSSSPPSSSTAAGLSPTTPLTSSMEEELLRRRPDGDEDEEEEDEEDEGMLLVEDMEVMGEDDLLFMGGSDEVLGSAAGGGGGGAAGMEVEMAMFFEGDSGYSGHFFSPPQPPPWLSNSNSSSNAAAAAGGR